MTRHDYGSGSDPLANPLHSAWAESVATDLDSLDSSVAGLSTTSLTDVSGTDPSGGMSLVWDEAQGVYVPRYAADAAGIVSLDYAYSTDMDVTQGQVALDSADPAQVTMMHIHTLDANGVDTSPVISMLAPPFWVGLTDQVNREQQLWKFDLTAPPTLAADVWQCPVVLREAVGPAFAQDQAVYILERFIADPSLYVNVAGDVMTGPLDLMPPSAPRNAARYADAVPRFVDAAERDAFYEALGGPVVGMTCWVGPVLYVYVGSGWTLAGGVQYATALTFNGPLSLTMQVSVPIPWEYSDPPPGPYQVMDWSVDGAVVPYEGAWRVDLWVKVADGPPKVACDVTRDGGLMFSELLPAPSGNSFLHTFGTFIHANPGQVLSGNVAAFGDDGTLNNAILRIMGPT